MEGENDLALAANGLFDDDLSVCTLTDGRTVHLKTATVKQLSLIISIFERLIASLDKGQLVNLIEVVVQLQKAVIAEGGDPTKIDLGKLSTEEVVSKAFGNTSLLMSIFHSCVDMVPQIVESFSDIPKKDLENAGLDDGALIIGSVFILNYDFFSQRLPPVLMGLMRRWASMQARKSAPRVKAPSTR